MKRRTFLEVSLAGAAGVLTSGLPKIIAAASTSKGEETFLLGGDLLVNRLGFGAMRLTGEGIWGWPPDRENAKKVLRRAVELGVNFIDTADAYGPETNELLIAEALYPYPKGLIIATKGGNTRPGPGQWVPDGRPEYLAQAVDKSLKRLKLERIDLWQLHRIDRKVPVEESLGAIKKAQDAGKIRHVGLSEVTVAEIEQAKKIVPIVSIQNRYNITDRESEAAINYCQKEKIKKEELRKTPNPPTLEASAWQALTCLAIAKRRRNVQRPTSTSDIRVRVIGRHPSWLSRTTSVSLVDFRGRKRARRSFAEI